MKLCALGIFVVLFVGCALGAAGVSSSTTQRAPLPNHCSSHLSDSNSVLSRGNICAESGATPSLSSDLLKAKDLDDYRTFFTSYCQRSSTVLNCLAEESNKLEVCQNENLLKHFNIYRNILETVLDLGCLDNGDRLATLWHGLNILYNDPVAVQGYSKCTGSITLLLGALQETNSDISFFLYKEIPRFQECLSEYNISQSLKEISDVFLERIARSLKCVHTKDGSLVKCSDIETSSSTYSSICDIKTRNGEVAIYDVLEDEAGSCFDDVLKLDKYEAGNLEELKEKCKDICKRNIFTVQCLYKPLSVAEACLNETEYRDITILTDSLIHLAEAVCEKKGKTLADVMFEVYRLQRSSTGGGDVVSECIHSAKRTRKTQDGAPPKTSRFYAELKVFKGCFLEKLHGDQKSKEAARSLIDSMLRKAQCVHPEEETTVLCETLGSNV